MKTPRARFNILAVSVGFVAFSVLSGCYRDREARHEDKVERKEDRKEEKYEEHHDH
jgi:hypothetical protein